MNDLPPFEGEYSFEPPFQIQHMTGGLSMLVSANGLCWLLAPGVPHLPIFSRMPKRSILNVAQQQPGIRILGRNNVKEIEDTADPISRDFITAAVNAKGTCLAHDQYQHWSGVAHALHNQNRDADALMVSRLDSQIKLCRNTDLNGFQLLIAQFYRWSHLTKSMRKSVSGATNTQRT
jgi:hypothetical protein